LLPLLWAFVIYFVGYHSYNGWRHLVAKFPEKPGTLWLASLPFSLGAYVLTFLFIYASPSLEESFTFEMKIKAFFIFLSCVSFPHVLEMSRFYKNSNLKSE